MQKSPLCELAGDYAFNFHRRLVVARPPHSRWPTDIDGPQVDYWDLLVTESKSTQTTIGIDALSYTEEKRYSTSLGSGAAKLLQTSPCQP